MQLRGNGGDSFDWFFLAMIHHKQGRKEQARDLYEKAVTWYHTQPAPNDDELYRFQVEAADDAGAAETRTATTSFHRARARAPSSYPGAPLIHDERSEPYHDQSPRPKLSTEA